MSSWTKILLSLLFSLSSLACDFRPEVKKIYSLSGPVTTALREFKLLKHPKLAGISYFYPASKQEFSGEIIPGGVFLSRATLDKFQNAVVFFDETAELARIFNSDPKIKSVEIVSREFAPEQVTRLVLQKLDPYLTGCEQEKKNLVKKVEANQKVILSKLSEPKMVIFFLGEIRGGKPPELVMANDGVVKWLREQKKIITYPSMLGYVNWSAKIMQALPATTLRVGIRDSGREKVKKLIKLSASDMNLIYPGGLIPGLDQLEALSFWLENL